MPTEAEGVAERDVDLGRLGLVGDDVHIHLGVEVLDVHGRRSDLVLDGEDGRNELNATGGTEEVTGHGFRRGDEELAGGVVTKGALDGAQLAHVTDGSRGGVGVDVVDIGRIDLSMAHGHLHALRSAEALGMRRGEVVGVGADTVSGELAVNRGTALLRVLEFFDHDDTGAFAHDESVAVPVERARGLFRIVVAEAEGLHVGEAREAAGADGGFRSAADHAVGIAKFDHPPGFTDVVVRGRAGGDDGHVRAHEAVLSGDHAAGDVGDHHRDEEGRDAAGALFQKDLILGFQRAEAADPTADHDADAMRIDAVRVHTAVLDGHFGRRHGELKVPVRAAGFLVIVEEGCRIEIRDLTTDFAIVVRGVHALDLPDPALSFEDAFPEIFLGVSDWGNHSDSGDDDAATVHDWQMGKKVKGLGGSENTKQMGEQGNLRSAPTATPRRSKRVRAGWPAFHSVAGAR